jgi:hypothetical protein
VLASCRPQLGSPSSSSKRGVHGGVGGVQGGGVPSKCVSPLGPKGGGQHSLADDGVGGPNSGD